MKQVRIDSLLEPPQDGAVFQREWTTRGQCGEKGMLLELALFAGMVGPGLFAVSALSKFAPGMLVGLLIVVLGYALPHAVFLGRMERSWRSILRPGSSWISRGSIFAGVFMALAGVTVVQSLSSGSPVLIAAVVAAALLAVYPGFMFSVLRAIPFWNSIFLIPLFLTQALGGGMALALILSYLPGVQLEAAETILAYEPVAIAGAAVLIAAHVYFRSRCGPTGKLSVEKLLRGTCRTPFLFGAVLVGLTLPLLLTALALLLKAPAVLVLPAAACQLAGIVFFKYCLLNVGLYSPIYDPRLARPA